jgi:hypothetical protein
MNLELSFELHVGIQFKHGLYMEGIEQMENQKSLSNLKNDLIDHHWTLKGNC